MSSEVKYSVAGLAKPLWVGLIAGLLAVLIAGCGDSSSDGSKPKKRGSKVHVTTGGTVDDSGTLEIDPERGRALFTVTCVTCHGMQGQGLPNQGLSLRKSQYVHEKTDEQLFEFMKVGREVWDPASVQKIRMPPRGGNLALDDGQLKDLVAFLRELQKDEAVVSIPMPTSVPSTAPTTSSATAPTTEPASAPTTAP